MFCSLWHDYARWGQSCGGYARSPQCTLLLVCFSSDANDEFVLWSIFLVIECLIRSRKKTEIAAHTNVPGNDGADTMVNLVPLNSKEVVLFDLRELVAGSKSH